MKKSLVLKRKQTALQTSGRRRLEIGQRRSDLRSLVDPSGGLSNPLDDAEYPNTLEGDADAEVSAALAAILEERKKKRDDYRLMADTDYWLCLCFQSRQQKIEFLRHIGWDKMTLVNDRYIDGLQCAQSLSVDIEPIELPARISKIKTPVILRRQEVISNETKN